MALEAICFIISAPAADFPPSILFSRLLDNTKLWSETGEFEMQSMWAVFLPVAGDLSINAEDHLTTSILDSNDSVIATFDWYVNKSDPPCWEMSHYECDQANGSRITLKPGDYFG